MNHIFLLRLPNCLYLWRMTTSNFLVHFWDENIGGLLLEDLKSSTSKGTKLPQASTLVSIKTQAPPAMFRSPMKRLMAWMRTTARSNRCLKVKIEAVPKSRRVLRTHCAQANIPLSVDRYFSTRLTIDNLCLVVSA